MKFSILTYNLLHNKAYRRLEDILKAYKPDIILLQEIETKEENLKFLQKFDYTLADYSNSFMYIDRVFGVATFYNQKKLKFVESRPIWLSRGFFEFIFDGLGRLRSILKTDFIFSSNSKKLSIYNIHLTAVGTNSVRIKQIKRALEFCKIEKSVPTIIAGDFNYPYRRKILERLMNSFYMKEATRNLTYTFKPQKKAGYILINKAVSFFAKRIYHGRYKLDYIYYKNLRSIQTTRIEADLSDHLPILSCFEL